MENLSRSTGLVQDLQTSWLTLRRSINMLPQYLQHQLVSALFFISQMYNLSYPPPKPHQDRSSLNAAETFSTHRGQVQAQAQVQARVQAQVQPQARPISRTRRLTRTPEFDDGYYVQGGVR